MAGNMCLFPHTFESAGEFPYFCMVHPWMEGIVTVGEAMMDGDKNGIPEELYDDPEEHDEKDATRTGMLSDGLLNQLQVKECRLQLKSKIQNIPTITS